MPQLGPRRKIDLTSASVEVLVRAARRAGIDERVRIDAKTGEAIIVDGLSREEMRLFDEAVEHELRLLVHARQREARRQRCIRMQAMREQSEGLRRERDRRKLKRAILLGAVLGLLIAALILSLA